jgi:hypothetical protein
MRRVLLVLVAAVAMAAVGSAFGSGSAPSGVDPKAYAGASYRVSPLDVKSAQWTPGGFDYRVLVG